MSGPTKLTKPVRRVTGRLVVELRPPQPETETQQARPAGLAIRGFRKKKWRFFSFEQIAALDFEPGSLLRVADETIGARVLRDIGATAPQPEAPADETDPPEQTDPAATQPPQPAEKEPTE